MPTYRIETNRGTFEVDANRAPTAQEVQALITSGQLQPVESPAVSPPAPPPSIRPTLGGGGMGAFGEALAGAFPDAPAGVTTPQGEGPLGVALPEGQAATQDIALPSAAQVTESLQEPVPRAVLGMSPDIGAELSGQQIGARIGGAVGSRFGPAGRIAGQGAGRIIGGGVASMGSALTQKRLRGQPITGQDVGNEALLTFLPEGIESGLRFAGRQGVRRLKGGQELRMQEAVDESIRSAPMVFNSPGRQASSDLFEQVAQSGVVLDTSSLTRQVNDLGTDRLDDIARIDLTTIDNRGRTGGRFSDIFDAIRAGDQVPIGDLQDFRSVLLRRGRNAPPEARRIIETIRGAVDNTIDNAPAIPLPGITADVVDQARATLAQARDGWRRTLAAENLAEFLGTRPVSSVARGGNIMRFNLNAMANQLRDNRSRIAREVNRSLDAVPGARANFEAFRENLSRIAPLEIRMTNTQGLSRLAFVAAANNALADVMTTELGRAALQRVVARGRGVMSVNMLAAIANAVRRQQAEGNPEGSITQTANQIVDQFFQRPQFPETAR